MYVIEVKLRCWNEFVCQVQFSVLYSAFQLSAILPFWPRVPEIGNIIKYLMIEIALLTKLSLIRIVQSKLCINHPRKWRKCSWHHYLRLRFILPGMPGCPFFMPLQAATATPQSPSLSFSSIPRHDLSFFIT